MVFVPAALPANVMVEGPVPELRVSEELPVVVRAPAPLRNRTNPLWEVVTVDSTVKLLPLLV